jgi:signal transduction histidine kinase
MRNLSLNQKLFFSLASIVLTVLFTILLLNSTVLETYYLKYKESSLIRTFKTFNTIYKDIYVDQDDFIDLEKIEINQNIDIVIKDFEKITVYSTSEDFTSNMLFIDKSSSTAINDFFEKKLTGSDQPFSTERLSDTKLSIDFLVLYGKLDNGYLVLLRTPIESIREAVQVINKFMILISLTTIILSSVLAYYISRSFTKPIQELNEIAKRITQLDFSKKYEGNATDEIGVLGSSINHLSNSLNTKIQELNKINLELEKDIEKTSKIAEMRNQFVSDVSHELKTPICLIQGYAEGLVDGVITDAEDKKYYCEVILDEANKMSKLTKELLDLSNLEYGNNALNIENFNIIELITNTLKKNEIIFRENEITVSFEHDKDCILAHGDIFRIEQVLTNYINNALKHVDENKMIKVNVTENNSKVKISIFNSGKNISEENLSRIWTKFYKEDVSRNREASGSGIGLSLVQAIMKKHNNNYGVENVSGGVEFWFELNTK